MFASCFGEVGWSGRGGNNVQVPVAHPVNAFSRHAHRWYSIDHVRLQGPWYFGSNLQPILDATLSTFLSNLQHALDAALSTLLSKLFFPSSFSRCLHHGIKTQEHPELHKLLYGYCWRQSVSPLMSEEFLKEIGKAVKACKCFWNKGNKCFSNPKLKTWNAKK